MIKRKGFTLTELMIALAVLGVLSAIVLPMLNGNTPSRNRMMMKKAYYTIEDVVRDLINDESLYPEVGTSGTYVGFDNTDNACTGSESCGGNKKFPTLFAKKLNVDGDVSIILPTTNSGRARFKTNDGMDWTVLSQKTSSIPSVITDVEPDASQYIQIITVDVNGDKKPNCLQSSSNDCNAGSKGRDVDQFSVYVTARGKIVPAANQPWFEDAISIDSSVNGD